MKFHQEHIDNEPRFICESCTGMVVGFPKKLTILQAKLHYRLGKHVIRTER